MGVRTESGRSGGDEKIQIVMEQTVIETGSIYPNRTVGENRQIKTRCNRDGVGGWQNREQYKYS